jgi:urease accessory protein
MAAPQSLLNAPALRCRPLASNPLTAMAAPTCKSSIPAAGCSKAIVPRSRSACNAAHLYLTTQAATKIYPAEHGEVTRQHIRLRVASGAILEYFPLPLIPFARALYVQEITIQVESGSVCLVADVLAPGRVARGECFAYHMVRSRVEGWVDDQLALFEHMSLQPERSSYAGLGVLDGKSYVASLYVLTSQALERWIPGWNHRLTEQYGECAGITALAQGGLVVRLLGQTGQEVLRRLDAAHYLIREEGLGFPPLQVYQPFA